MFMRLLSLLLAGLTIHCVGASAVVRRQSTAPTLPAGWSSIGCYSDSTSSRTLKVASFTDVTGMTIESCLAFCTPSGYKYAGVEFARECYCDNVIEAPAVIETDGGCNMPCTGNAAEICGGASRINIFQNTAVSTQPPPVTTTGFSTIASTTTTSVPTPTPTIKKSVGTFEYVGCFEDGIITTFRTLGTGVTVPGGVNAEGCTAACKAAGFPLAGLEFGQECWCDTFMEIVNVTPDSDCNKPCQADPTELCGAGSRLAVYQDTSAAPPNPQKCLTNFQLSLIDFHFQAVHSPQGGVRTPLTAVDISGTPDESLKQLLLLGIDDGSSGSLNIFFLSGGSVWLDELGLSPPLAPVVGGPQLWITEPIGSIVVEPYNQYCGRPNPLGLFGPFIGPPILSVNGQTDQWAFCTNTTAGGRVDVVYSPIATSPDYVLSQCQSVLLELQT